MDHKWPMLGSILADVRQIKSFWHIEIKLNRAELPRPSDRVLHEKVNLWAVESAVARIDLVFDPRTFECFFQGLFGNIPVFFPAHAFLRPGTEKQFETIETKGSK